MRLQTLLLAALPLAACNSILSNKVPYLVTDAGPDSGAGTDGGGSGGAGGMSGGGAGGTSGGGAGGNAGSGGTAPVDLCKGVTCKTPPANDCTSEAEFQSYDTIGTCADGVCSYVSHQTACTCQNHACTTDPCLSVTCDTPPAAACTGQFGNTQTTYATSGECSAGSCRYAPTDKDCAFGCTNGACNADPCAGVTCNMPPTGFCKTTAIATTYPATGTCSAGNCSYPLTNTGCGTNKVCTGQGVCSECKTDSSCGATCVACAGGTPKCKDLGTTSKCVACVSNADCGGVTPVCNTTTNVCITPPSCVGLAVTCGPNGNASCCASNAVTGGPFNLGNDANYPATVSDFRLDTYEITVGRFRKFWNAYPGNMPAAGSGKNPNNASDSGWDATWNASSLPASQAALTTNIECDATFQTWTASDDNLPITCIDWYEAEAFCIWDGGRLPTEAEWNYAAAGGAAQRAYPWGGTLPDCTLANFYGGAAGTTFCVASGANRVGSESPQGDGRYGQADLAGNVWEWVQDWYITPYPTPCINCSYPTATSSRGNRGGSFHNAGSAMLSTSRNDAPPSYHLLNYGARCARAR